jgi:glutathione S-transferase
MPPYKLYARNNTGSAAVEALLALLGLPYELIEVSREPDKSIPNWYRAINPRGEVPTLILPDATLMTESAAMMIYLADLVPAAKLAPAPDAPTRATYLRWMIYMAAAPYTSDLRLYYSQRYSTDPTHANAIRDKATSDLAADFAHFAEALGEGPFILGAEMTAADIYTAMLLSWTPDMDALFTRHARLRALYEAVGRVPEVRSVWDRNGMT